MVGAGRSLYGKIFGKHSNVPGLSTAGGGAVDIAPGIISAIIYDSQRNQVVVTFNGVPGGSVNTGVQYTIDGGVKTPFFRGSITGNSVYYDAEGNFSAGDVVRWIYTPGNITVDGELLDAKDIPVQNRILSAPLFVSGRIYESLGIQYAEITFSVPMIYDNYTGVTIKADGTAKAITDISGYGTTKITYTTSGINHLHTVTWSYKQIDGNLRNAGGDPLGDVTDEVISNVLPFQTFWDPVANDPTTYWDGNPPNETEWDKT